jgi:DNA-binding NarL/FixJ family response regulator
MQSYEYDEDDITKVTSREREILILISNGMSNKEIANELNITERTVKNHITNLFKKINVCDRTQAAVYAIKNNIVLCENSYPHI